MVLNAHSYCVIGKLKFHRLYNSSERKIVWGKVGHFQNFFVSLISILLNLNWGFRRLESVSQSSVDMRARGGYNCTPTTSLFARLSRHNWAYRCQKFNNSHQVFNKILVLQGSRLFSNKKESITRWKTWKTCFFFANFIFYKIYKFLP